LLLARTKASARSAAVCNTSRHVMHS
jgi:hypothetical protein